MGVEITEAIIYLETGLKSFLVIIKYTYVI